MKNKTFTVFIIACITVAAVISYTNPLFGADEDAPTMYVNDEPWYNESQYKKWYNIYLVDYIPISMMGKIDGIEIKENKYLRNVIISYGKDKYITFDIDASIVYTAKGEQYSAATTLIYGERYIPARLVCDCLGLNFEITKNEKAIRISDNTAKKSFNELLEIYNPSLLESITTKTETTTVNQDPAETSGQQQTIGDIGDRTIYFTFTGCPNEYTGEILDLLEKYGYKALFLLNEENIREYITETVRIAAAGHAIGIGLGNNDGMFTEKARQINNVLYNLIKHKTRIVGIDVNIDDDDYLSLESAGFTVIDFNGNIPDNKNYSVNYLSAEAYDYIHDFERIFFRFNSTGKTAAVLEKILEYISDKPGFSVELIKETTQDGN